MGSEGKAVRGVTVPSTLYLPHSKLIAPTPLTLHPEKLYPCEGDFQETLHELVLGESLPRCLVLPAWLSSLNRFGTPVNIWPPVGN